MENKEPTQKRSPFFYFIEILGWLQIFASPFLISCILGTIVYFSVPDLFGIVVAIIIVIAGILTGAIWASSKWKKEGTTHYISRVVASPDLDPKEGC